MNTFNLLFIFGVGLLIIVAFWWVRRRSSLQGDQVSTAKAAIAACSTMLDLVSHIQQHRGMSTAFLAGDQSFARRLANKRMEIEPMLAQLQQIALAEYAYNYPCFTPNDVNLWRHRWGLLVQELNGYTVEKSIAAHSNLIAMLLNWLGSVGEARVELPLNSVLPDGAVRNFSHRLPQLTETLGQARATGSGVAAQGTCSAVARVRLMFLVSRAESLVDQACSVDPQGAVAAQKVKTLAMTIRTHMLASQQVNVSAEEYFAEATRAIDAVFAWGRDCGRALDAQVGQVASGYKHPVAMQGGK